MKLLIISLLFISTTLPQENYIKSFAEKFISTLNQNPELLYDFLPTITELQEVFPDAINSGISDSLLSFYFIRKRSLEIKLEEIFLLQSLFENKKISANGDVRTDKVNDETENIFFLVIPIIIDSTEAWFSLSVIQSADRIFLLEILNLKNNIYKKKLDVEFEEEAIEGELISPSEPIELSTPVKNSRTPSLKKNEEELSSITPTTVAIETNQLNKNTEALSIKPEILNDSLPAHSNFVELYKLLKSRVK